MSRVCGNRRSGDAVSSLFYNNAVHVWNILYLSVRLMLLSQISVKESTIFIYIYMWLIIMNIDICSQRTTGLYFFSRLQMKYNYTCMPYYGTTFSNSLFIRLVPSFFENFADLFFCLLSFFVVVFGLFVRMPLSTCWGLPIIPCDHMNVQMHVQFILFMTIY